MSLTSTVPAPPGAKDPVRLLALDSYGTMFDVQSGLSDALQAAGLPDASNQARIWVEGVMAALERVNAAGPFRPFPELVAGALDEVLTGQSVVLSPSQRDGLLDAWRKLTVFPDIKPALERAGDLGIPVWVVTNGDLNGIAALLQQNGLTLLVNGIMTAEAAGRYKPAREIYEGAASSAGVLLSQMVMVSALPIDINGAIAAGCRGAYLNRQDAAPHWEASPPTWSINNLSELIEQLPPPVTRPAGAGEVF